MDLRLPVFRPPVLNSACAFALAEMQRGPMFLSGEFVDVIVASGFSPGTEFRLASDAPDPVA